MASRKFSCNKNTTQVGASGRGRPLVAAKNIYQLWRSRQNTLGNSDVLEGQNHP